MEKDIKVFEQLSFYFSDANLKYDKFMQQLTGAFDDNQRGKGAVKLEEFLKFTLIKELVNDVETIERIVKDAVTNKSVHYHTELVFDEVHKTLARREDFNDQDTSDRNIFVIVRQHEKLTSNRQFCDYLKANFSVFGEVMSVRLNSIRETKTMNAYIEYWTKEDAERAVNLFNDTEYIRLMTDVECIVSPPISLESLNSMKKRYYKIRNSVKEIHAKLNKKFARDDEIFDELFKPKNAPIPEVSSHKNKRSFEQANSHQQKPEEMCVEEHPEGEIVQFEMFSSTIESFDFKKTKQKIRSFIDSENTSNVFGSISTEVDYFHITPDMMTILEYPQCVQKFYIRTRNPVTVTTFSSEEFGTSLKKFFDDASIREVKIKNLSSEGKQEYWNVHQKAKKTKQC